MKASLPNNPEISRRSDDLGGTKPNGPPALNFYAKKRGAGNNNSKIAVQKPGLCQIFELSHDQ